MYGIQGCNTCGGTLEEVLDMIKEAMDMCLEEEDNEHNKSKETI